MKINWHFIIAMIINTALWVGLILLLNGCKSTSETTTVKLKGDIVFQNTIKSDSFMYWTRASGLKHSTPFTLTAINNIESAPDPNGIEEVSDGAVNAFLRALGLF
jgi:uncharacterized membrane protein YwaF